MSTIPYSDFHETHTCSTALCSDLVYRISPKTYSTSVNCGYKLIHILCEVRFFTVPIFRKLIYMTNKLLWTSPVQNSIQLERKT